MRETFVLNTDIYIVYLQKSYDYWVACEWRQEEDLILGSCWYFVGISQILAGRGSCWLLFNIFNSTDFMQKSKQHLALVNFSVLRDKKKKNLIDTFEKKPGYVIFL